GGPQSASDLVAVAGSPHLAALETLDAGGDFEIDDGAFTALVHGGPGGQPAYRSLRRLDGSGAYVRGTGPPDHAIRNLLDSPFVRTLTHLNFNGHGAISPNAIQSLCDSPLWGRLEEVDLGGVSADEVPDYRALAGAIARSRLRRLNLNSIAY